MTRGTLDLLLRMHLRETDDRYWAGWAEVGGLPEVIRHQWGKVVPREVREEKMNPIIVLKLFGAQALAKALADLLRRKATVKAYDELAECFETALQGCKDRDAAIVASAFATALLHVK